MQLSLGNDKNMVDLEIAMNFMSIGEIYDKNIITTNNTFAFTSIFHIISYDNLDLKPKTVVALEAP